MHERVTGATTLKFLAAIEKAMDEAGAGQYRAFKLLSELDGMGLEITARDMPPERIIPDLNSALPESIER